MRRRRHRWLTIIHNSCMPETSPRWRGGTAWCIGLRRRCGRRGGCRFWGVNQVWGGPQHSKRFVAATDSPGPFPECWDCPVGAWWRRRGWKPPSDMPSALKRTANPVIAPFGNRLQSVLHGRHRFQPVGGAAPPWVSTLDSPCLEVDWTRTKNDSVRQVMQGSRITRISTN